MSLQMIAASLLDLNSAVSRMRRKVCDAARAAEEAARRAGRTRWFPLWTFDITIMTSGPPRFEPWTRDTFWYFQGDRFVSREEMERIWDEYNARQAAFRLADEQRARGGGD